MTNLNVLLVVQVLQVVALVVWDLVELKGVEVLEYLMQVVLLLKYFLCFTFIISQFNIFY